MPSQCGEFNSHEELNGCNTRISHMLWQSRQSEQSAYVPQAASAYSKLAEGPGSTANGEQYDTFSPHRFTAERSTVAALCRVERSGDFQSDALKSNWGSRNHADTDLIRSKACVTSNTNTSSLIPAVLAEALNARVAGGIKASPVAYNSSSKSRDCQSASPDAYQVDPISCDRDYPPSCYRERSTDNRRKSFDRGCNVDCSDNTFIISDARLDSSNQSQKRPSLWLGPGLGTTAKPKSERFPQTKQKVPYTTPPNALQPLLSTFDPDAYGNPARVKVNRENIQPARKQNNRQGSPSPDSTAPIQKSLRSHTDIKLRETPGKLEIAPSGDTGGWSKRNPLDSSSPVPTDNFLVENLSLSEMPPNKSAANRNDGSYTAPGSKSQRVVDGNFNSQKADMPVTAIAKQEESREEKLQRLQTEALIKVGFKIRQQGGEPTTSPQTLHLARQPSSNNPVTQTIPGNPKTNITSSSAVVIQQNNQPSRTKVMAPIHSVVSSQAVAREPQETPNSYSARSTTGTKGRKSSRLENDKNNSDARRARWATAAELKPPQLSPKSIDSNAFGTEMASDVETASGDSVAAMDNGRLVRNHRPAGPDAPLADWSGNWMPPPIEWDGRPRFNNNSPEFVGGFTNWTNMTTANSVNGNTGVAFTRLPTELVENSGLHPDGLDLVDPTMTVDEDTAERYGYCGEALEIIKRDAQLVCEDIFEQDWGKVDMRDPENAKFKNECCNDLVRNYNANIAKDRDQEISLQHAQKLARRQQSLVATPNPHIPRINIYLRPALRSDIHQLQEIYNSYVTNSGRTSEAQPITYSNMLDRWTESTSEKLPFIVAVSKSAKINREVGNAVEKILGWASATDLVSRQAAERFTVDLEIWVHQQHLHQGVGKCLMDKLMDSTDRGHIARKGYPFACAPEEQHGYSAGGARDLIKLQFLVRSFEKPQDRKENDLPWIKKWLEKEWSFEQQAFHAKYGVRFKRYINHTVFTRTTAYTPKEGTMPEDGP